jgi:photosystem II stability/assembly factor-like uncharacterized protein
MHTLWIASRKGLFTATQHGRGQWAITGHHFAGEPVSQALTVGSTWYAALRLGHFGVKLHKSVDGGNSWAEVAAPALPQKPAQGPWADDTTPWNVEMIWSLAASNAAAGAAHPQRLWAGCMPAGLFCSDDGGASWTLCESFWLDERRKGWFGGGNDYPGIHSICIDPRDADHVTLAISCGGIWSTRDAGKNWALIGQGMINTYMPPEQAGDPNTQDPHCISACAAAPQVMWMQHHCGIFRSEDSGAHWDKVAGTSSAGDFGFAVAADPRDAKRAWFVPAQADTHRYAPGAAMCVTRTDDGGASFKVFRSGLPQQHAYDLIYRHSLCVADDAQTLAMASTTGRVWVSEDAGQHWQCVSSTLPPVAALGFVQ